MSKTIKEYLIATLVVLGIISVCICITLIPNVVFIIAILIVFPTWCIWIIKKMIYGE